MIEDLAQTHAHLSTTPLSHFPAALIPHRHGRFPGRHLHRLQPPPSRHRPSHAHRRRRRHRQLPPPPNHRRPFHSPQHLVRRPFTRRFPPLSNPPSDSHPPDRASPKHRRLRS